MRRRSVESASRQSQIIYGRKLRLNRDLRGFAAAALGVASRMLAGMGHEIVIERLQLGRTLQLC
jgi:hypothetical protein